MKLKKFFLDLKADPRIPLRDKKLLVFFLALPLLPILFVPTFISTEGFFLSLWIWSFVLDYFFNVLDQTLFLSLYPYDMKSYNSTKRASEFLTMFTPTFITGQIWEYKKDPIA